MNPANLQSPVPLDGLPTDIQAKILACIPPSEVTENGYTARALVGLMEGIKRYGTPAMQLIAEDTIPRIIAADNERRRRQEAIRHAEENPDDRAAQIAGLEAAKAILEGQLADVEAELAMLEEEGGAL